mgnify:CR=1 FL=1
MYIAIMVSLAAIAFIGCVRYPWFYIPVDLEYRHIPCRKDMYD